MVYVVIGSGKNKEGEVYSKLAPLVELRSGDAYLNIKNCIYVNEKYPILKKLTTELKGA